MSIARTRHFTRDAHRVSDRQLAVTLEARPQRLAGHERHHVVQQAVGVAAVEQRENVRMLQPRGGEARERVAHCGTSGARLATVQVTLP